MLGLNNMFSWAKAQAKSGEWQIAGSVCQYFANSMKAVDWSGEFYKVEPKRQGQWDSDQLSRWESWDWNESINQTFSPGGSIDQLCNTMNGMT